MTGKNGKRFLLAAIVTGVHAGLVLTAFAALEQGGKAEPKRIEFTSGASSASVSDRIRGAEEAEYVLGAESGQEIIFELDAVSRNLVTPTASGPDNEPVLLEKDRTGRWHTRVEKRGDYMVVIKKNKSTAGAVKYSLKVRIPPK